MKPLTTFIVLAVVGLAGCHATRSDTHAHVRTIVLRSHLSGPLRGDPRLRPGESVRIVPAEDESVSLKTPVVAVLPLVTPYRGLREQLFLRGYATGFMRWMNIAGT